MLRPGGTTVGETRETRENEKHTIFSSWPHKLLLKYVQAD